LLAHAGDEAGAVTDPLLPGERTTMEVVALLYAISILLLGVFGFIPGITTNFEAMELAGDESAAQVVGAFQTSVLHNLIHALVGIAGIFMARTWQGARTFLLGGGAFFVALWLLGVVGGAVWIPSDSADNWLHLGMGGSMIAVALLFVGESQPGRRRAESTLDVETSAPYSSDAPKPIQKS
jgi:Domain of unknown function (DUF4383)